MGREIPESARVVIVGGGVIGASIAWHLAEAGCPDVLLLERGELGCGTTWHSAGNIIRMNADRTTAEIYTYGAQLLSEFQSRRDIGWRQCGRMMLARDENRATEFWRIIDTLQGLDVQVKMVTPDEVRAKIPVMNVEDVHSALWSPGDGRVNPTDLVNAYVQEARDKGVRVMEGVTVDQAIVENRKVTGVRTDRGDIRCEAVVNCAGMWARELGMRNDVAIPLYAVEHFYVLTETIDGVYADMPTFRDPDGLIYGREEVGGMLLGCFDRDAIPVATSDLPQPFYFSLLDENWDQFMPYMEQGVHRIPALEQAGIRMLLNGPESFTPDTEPHLDRAPDIEGYFVLAGLSSAGVTRSAGMGRSMAHWIVEGDPGMDVSRYSLRRFRPEQNGEDYLRQCIRDVPSGRFGTK